LESPGSLGNPFGGVQPKVVPVVRFLVEGPEIGLPFARLLGESADTWISFARFLGWSTGLVGRKVGTHVCHKHIQALRANKWCRSSTLARSRERVGRTPALVIKSAYWALRLSSELQLWYIWRRA